MKLAAALVSLILGTVATVAAAENGGSGGALPPAYWPLLGRYAHYDVVAYVEPIPFGEFRSLVITYGFTDFTLDPDGRLREQETFCHASHKSNQPVSSQVADAFTRAIGPKPAFPTWQWDGSVLHLWRPETPTLLGMDLPEGEVLPLGPLAADDSRIRDDDQDGKPGVTVKLRLIGFFDAELYLARRERFAYELSWRPTVAGRAPLSGVVHDRSEQLILGAEPSWLGRAANPQQYGDLSQSPMVLVPVAADLACDQLMAQREALFPAEPEVW